MTTFPAAHLSGWLQRFQVQQVQLMNHQGLRPALFAVFDPNDTRLNVLRRLCRALVARSAAPPPRLRQSMSEKSVNRILMDRLGWNEFRRNRLDPQGQLLPESLQLLHWSLTGGDGRLRLRLVDRRTRR
jgi:hypothetical protein